MLVWAIEAASRHLYDLKHLSSGKWRTVYKA
jgi:hypothetical protein